MTESKQSTDAIASAVSKVRRSADEPVHALDVDRVLAALEARREGLGVEEAERRLASHGPNRLPEPPRRGPIRRFLAQFENLLIYVLLGAAAITALLGHWIDTAVIGAVVLVNASIGFLQEGKAERALAAIRDMLAPRAAVLREGRRQTISADAIVPGDLVLLEPGDRVPADLRLLGAHGLRIEEAVLTGESMAVDKDTAPVAADAALGDRRSMAFSGTLVTAGQGRGVVVATGAATQIGRISTLVGSVEAVATPLTRQMGQFARWLTGFVLVFAALILGVGTWTGSHAFSELFMAVVGLSVAAIPEGLPAILTVTLAIGVQRMAQRKAIVRRLPAIEALGAVSVICSDKTGTLTRNEMTVARVATAQGETRITGAGYAPHGGFERGGQDIDPMQEPALLGLMRAALLCSEAEVTAGDDAFEVHGDPMEGALVTAAWKAGLEPAETRRRNPQTDAIPFDAAHRFMATLHHDHQGQSTIYVKGAPERLVEMARHQRDAHGRKEPLDAAYWQAEAERLAASGHRVLAIATRPGLPGQHELTFADVEGRLTLEGLVGLMDPPREEAIAAVAECRRAGIAVKMITGDHAGTASAIARQLGLADPDRVLTGAEIDGLSDDALETASRTVNVFARTSPAHKLRLVKALQGRGESVAMTGDGVNDAPALKRADIGVAMGRTGTEAAKEAAEIVLADDNFATLAAAIHAGRTVYDNLKKAVLFLLPVNGGESLTILAALLLGVSFPITPVQILWVNMVSSVLLAMTLAFEPSEPGIMDRPPRRRREPLLTGFLLWRIAFVSSLFAGGIFAVYLGARGQGVETATARTMAVNALVVMEIFYLFAVRFLHQPSMTLRGVLGTGPVLMAIAAVALLQALFTHAPLMQTFFGTAPLGVGQSTAVIACGVAVLVILEIEKRILQARAREGAGTTAASG
jgi:magnesium-transporting ATPase (P-type)